MDCGVESARRVFLRNRRASSGAIMCKNACGVCKGYQAKFRLFRTTVQNARPFGRGRVCSLEARADFSDPLESPLSASDDSAIQPLFNKTAVEPIFSSQIGHIFIKAVLNEEPNTSSFGASLFSRCRFLWAWIGKPVNTVLNDVAS